MTRLAGTVAVVTGAGAGLGRAAALTLGAEGAEVIGVSLLADELAEVRETARNQGINMLTLQADVADADRTGQVREEVLSRFGRIDLLINNAGIIFVKPIEETSVEEWDRLLAVNLRSAFLYSRAFVPTMKEQRGGTIINVSSLAGAKGFVGESAYCSSKFGIEGLTYSLALELAPWNVRSIVVHPGALMRTPMSMTTYDKEARKAWRDPMDLAPGFVYLAADDDPGLSGKRFSVWELAQRSLAV